MNGQGVIDAEDAVKGEFSILQVAGQKVPEGLQAGRKPRTLWHGTAPGRVVVANLLYCRAAVPDQRGRLFPVWPHHHPKHICPPMAKIQCKHGGSNLLFPAPGPGKQG